MKKKIYLLLLTLSMPFIGSSQVYDNFKITEHKVEWEKIFDTGLGIDSLKTRYMKDVIDFNNITDYTLTGDKIIIKAKDVRVHDMGYPINYVAVVYFKDNRYKVDVNEIWINTENSSLGGFSTGNIMIETYLLKSKNTKWKSSSSVKKIKTKLNAHFLKSYQMPVNPIKSDDW